MIGITLEGKNQVLIAVDAKYNGVLPGSSGSTLTANGEILGLLSKTFFALDKKIWLDLKKLLPLYKQKYKQNVSLKLNISELNKLIEIARQNEFSEAEIEQVRRLYKILNAEDQMKEFLDLLSETDKEGRKLDKFIKSYMNQFIGSLSKENGDALSAEKQEKLLNLVMNGGQICTVEVLSEEIEKTITDQIK